MSDASLIVRVLGTPEVTRQGVPVALPRSRKVRALLAYLALSPAPVSRARLCGLLWDVPNDPRGELRWCLSKLRGLLDSEDRRRVVTREDLVSLDLQDCRVDVHEVEGALQAGIEALDPERLAELCGLFRGDLLEGVEIDGNPEFGGWLSAQRSRYRGLHVAVLDALATRAPTSDETFKRLDAWLQLAPFDPRAHERMFDTLVKGGRIRQAEDHLAATIRSFEQEGIDWAPLRQAWRASREAAALRVEATTERIEPPPAPRIEVAPAPAGVGRSRRRASVAVMPFVDRLSGQSDRGRVADGLTEDIIMQLAKLRLLFVIGRGTVFALGDRGIGPQEAGRILAVDYVASGSVRREASGRIAVAVELADAQDGRIVWTDTLGGAADDTFSVLDEIVARIAAAIAEEIELVETQRAILKPPSSLDAWEAYHRGLWHMYKFNGPDNRHAGDLFRAALELDPTFARAHAGLSFTHFQNAFLGLTPDRERQIELAFETAGHSLGADDHDPVAHWAMGRALWLRGAQVDSLAELQRSVELSPSFALGHYTLGFVQSQSGDPRAAIEASNFSRQLSPFDPLQFGMLASRALAHVRLDEHEEAADWAVKATSRPNAHEHILAIAAQCLALVDRRDEARAFVGRIRERLPGYGVEQFLRAFRLGPETEALFRQAARRIGFDV
jgi:DNA-binding SARP family transcriptional activator/TolB-like protein